MTTRKRKTSARPVGKIDDRPVEKVDDRDMPADEPSPNYFAADARDGVATKRCEVHASAKVERPTVRQCLTCPWKVETVPDRDIPNGYSVELHEALSGTIQSGLTSLFRSCKTAMACHYAKHGEEFPCAGWLHNQLGIGNNIAVRLAVMHGQLPMPEVDGEQHERFEDTLPKKPKRAATPKTKTPPRKKKVL